MTNLVSEHISSLTIDTRIRIVEMIRIADEHFGVKIHPYCGLRTCEEQAKTFRATRTKREVQAKAQSYKDKGFPILAQVLLGVGPQGGELGKHKTKAGPGESWHQYGQAEDCVPIVNGRAIWDDKDPEDARMWAIYGHACEYVGLTWSGRWTSFKETAHCQLSQHSNPLNAFREEKLLVEALRKVGSLLP